MSKKNLYTALGHFERRKNGCGRFCPVVILNGKEYLIDLQELVLWSSLNGQILNREEIGVLYIKTTLGTSCAVNRPWEACLDQLLLRGLIVVGNGDSEYDALYDLLRPLSIVPIDGSYQFRCASFIREIFSQHASAKNVWKWIHHKHQSNNEKWIMILAKTLLSTEEIIKYVEQDIHDLSKDRFLSNTVHEDLETDSDNVISIACARLGREKIILAVANLYLRKQIIFERV